MTKLKKIISKLKVKKEDIHRYYRSGQSIRSQIVDNIIKTNSSIG
ncbi:hypothetical protein PV797_04525 [Clostridiaceae bacterium M8S5]|nr:hypothetical protein PV797_04525 [Clostridiaceae bacterium M8S5]